MFNSQRLKNWTKSSVNDDKKELEVYQLFKDQIYSIEEKIKEYISEFGYDDNRLKIEYNGMLVTLDFLLTLKDSTFKNKDLSVQDRAKQASDLTYLYNQKLKELESKIIELSLIYKDNVYLITISSYIKIVNSLLAQYASLTAIKNSSVQVIDNNGELTAADKIKRLKDCIDIRIAEIESRLAIEEMRRH